MSLTGDPFTDRLAPIAVRFVAAVHDQDADLIDELLAEAIEASGGRCDPGAALAVLCAAAVPERMLDRSMSEMFGPARIRAEYARLCASGVAQEVVEYMNGRTAAA